MFYSSSGLTWRRNGSGDGTAERAAAARGLAPRSGVRSPEGGRVPRGCRLAAPLPLSAPSRPARLPSPCQALAAGTALLRNTIPTPSGNKIQEHVTGSDACRGQTRVLKSHTFSFRHTRPLVSMTNFAGYLERGSPPDTGSGTGLEWGTSVGA